MPGGLKGMIVAFFNTIVVAVLIAITSGEKHALDVVVVITMIGTIPAVLTGALLGFIADHLRHVNRLVVLVLLLTMACVAVAALGQMFDMTKLVIVCCVPTAAACSILERWTRPKPEESFPVARVA
jgi:MFS family permease